VRREIPVDTEECIECRFEAAAYGVVVIIGWDAGKSDELVGPLVLEVGDPFEEIGGAFQIGTGPEQGTRRRKPFEELGVTCLPPEAEVMDRFPCRQKEGPTVRFRDKLPEWTSQGRRVSASLEIGTVEELDDGFADLTAANHCGRKKDGAWNVRSRRRHRPSMRRYGRLRGRG